MGVEVAAHEGEDFDEDGVADGVEDLVAGFAVDDELLGSEDGEVLRDVGLLHAQLFDELAGGKLSGFKELDDGEAGGVSEGLEDVCFESAERVWGGGSVGHRNIR